MQVHKLHDGSEFLSVAEYTGILGCDTVSLGKFALKDEGTLILYNIYLPYDTRSHPENSPINFSWHYFNFTS
jgi:hypothetical protein